MLQKHSKVERVAQIVHLKCIIASSTFLHFYKILLVEPLMYFLFDMAGILEYGGGTCRNPPQVNNLCRLSLHSFSIL